MASLESKVDPRSAALVVVDVQNDFCHEEGASSKNASGPGDGLQRSMIPTLNKLIDAAREVKLPVVFIQTTHSPTDDTPVWSERHENRKHYICAEGEWGAEFYGVAPKPGDYIVNKHRYSAFAKTNLDDLLSSLSVKSIICTGVATGACVESTARHGFWLDYFAVVVSDATGQGSRTAHEEALDRMARSFATVVTADEILACWAEMKALATP